MIEFMRELVNSSVWNQNEPYFFVNNFWSPCRDRKGV